MLRVSADTLLADCLRGALASVHPRGLVQSRTWLREEGLVAPAVG
jgi:hypothetical protein